MGLSTRPACSARIRAVAAEPVKLMQRTSGRSKNTSATSPASPGACVTTFSTPGGKPASSRISACSRPAEIGACSEGFRTTVLPNAIGRIAVRQARLNAPFHGVKPATTPRGLRTAIATRPGVSLGRTSPLGR